MLLIVALGVLCSQAEGAVWRRQAFFNSSQAPFQQPFQGQYPQYPQFPPQQQGQQQPFPPFQPQQPGQQPFPGFPGQPPFSPQGFFPQQQQQQQQQQQLQGQRADVPLPAQGGSTQIPIIKLDIQPNLGDGKYQYSYETGNGITAEEKGSQKEVGEPAEAGTVASGSYSYTDPDGNLVQVSYTADENGFVPTGSHIPTPPPVPPEILAALEKNAQEEAAQNGGVVSPSYHHFFRTAYRHRYY